MAKKVRRVRRKRTKKEPVESQNMAALTEEEEQGAPQARQLASQEKEQGAPQARQLASHEEELGAPQAKRLTSQEEELSTAYAYVMKDLRRVFLLAALLFVLLIALNLLLG